MSTHIEPLLTAAIRAAFPAAKRVVTETPADLVTQTPLVCVEAISGGGDAYGFESPIVDVSVFDAAHDGMSARENSRTLAQQIRGWLLGLELGDVVLGTAPDVAFVLEVTQIMGPKWVPYDDTDVRRFVMSFGFRLHTRSTA